MADGDVNSKEVEKWLKDNVPEELQEVVKRIMDIAKHSSPPEIYAMLVECKMDDSEATFQLLSQGDFQEVKSKRNKPKNTSEKHIHDRELMNSGAGDNDGKDLQKKMIGSCSTSAIRGPKPPSNSDLTSVKAVPSLQPVTSSFSYASVVKKNLVQSKERVNQAPLKNLYTPEPQMQIFEPQVNQKAVSHNSCEPKVSSSGNFGHTMNFPLPHSVQPSGVNYKLYQLPSRDEVMHCLSFPRKIDPSGKFGHVLNSSQPDEYDMSPPPGFEQYDERNINTNLYQSVDSAALPGYKNSDTDNVTSPADPRFSYSSVLGSQLNRSMDHLLQFKHQIGSSHVSTSTGLFFPQSIDEHNSPETAEASEKHNEKDNSATQEQQPQQ